MNPGYPDPQTSGSGDPELDWVRSLVWKFGTRVEVLDSEMTAAFFGIRALWEGNVQGVHQGEAKEKTLFCMLGDFNCSG